MNTFYFIHNYNYDPKIHNEAASDKTLHSISDIVIDGNVIVKNRRVCDKQNIFISSDDILLSIAKYTEGTIVARTSPSLRDEWKLKLQYQVNEYNKIRDTVLKSTLDDIEKRLSVLYPVLPDEVLEYWAFEAINRGCDSTINRIEREYGIVK